MTSFIPHTPEERQLMLSRIGVSSVDDLFSALPPSIKAMGLPQALPMEGKTELSLQQDLTRASLKNTGAGFDCFLGGGAYQRFIPPAVNSIASRSEFYTAYTPYQPEVSQGTLQMVYEFQTMMCELTGMAVTNASVYDGAHAVAESVLMALRATRRSIVYASKTLNPMFQQVLTTYLDPLEGVELVWFSPTESLEGQLKHDAKQVACVVVQQPDYFGIIRPLQPYQAFTSDSGALLIVSVDTVSLGVLEPPGAQGAHIVCGDTQQFGNPVNFGGPYAGFIATTEKLMRQLPGRLVGKAQDKNGKTAYTLTLQTREQHIRRDKATSNICTNQSLNVLKATVYMSLVGPQGLRQIATVSAEGAHLLANQLLSLPGVVPRYEGPFLNEFAVQLPIPASIFVKQMAEHHGILAGIDLGKYWPEESHTLLVAVTEMNSLDSIGRYAEAFKVILHHHGLSVVNGKNTSDTAKTATGTFGKDLTHA